jgi:hypothetical protein
MAVKLSQQIEQVLAPPTVSLEKVLATFKTSSFGFLLALVALPSALPVPAPGFSVPFGLLIIVIAVQIIIGRKEPWVPASWQQKRFSTVGFKARLGLILKFIRFFEWFVKPRFELVFRLGLPFYGFLVLLGGLSMLIPIPGTNTIPAVGVFIVALGLIERDGVAALFGSMVALFGLVLTTTILWFGGQGLMWFLQALSF